MATVTKSSINISNAVAYSSANGNGGQRTANSAVTTASNEYMILNFNYGGSAGDIVNLGTSSAASAVAVKMANTIFSSIADANGVLNAVLYIGPSTTIYYGTSATGPGAAQISLNGQRFVNT